MYRFSSSLFASVSLFAGSALGCASEDDATDPPLVAPVPEEPNKEPPGSKKPIACTMRAGVTLSLEERRLVNRLPGTGTPFAEELLKGTGFDVFEREFAASLCKDGKTEATSYEEAKALVTDAGKRLWRAAVERVQGKRRMGTLPAGDDRMLYWARLTMTKTLRAWDPELSLTDMQRGELEWELERASRGQYDIVLPEGANVVRIIVSGFDPFTLGDPGATDDVSIRIGNPSGAAVLAYDGVEFPLPNGKTAHIEAYVLPVNYAPFERGMQEDTLGPFFRPGPQRVDISVTMSQGGGYEFKLEEYNGRFHGQFEGNDGVATCKASGGQLLASTPGCNILPPARWTGYESVPWKREQPPQFVESSLPIDAIMAAKTGERVPPPPGTQAENGNAFDVIWGYDYSVFPDCGSPATQSRYSPPSRTYPPAVAPEPPPKDACARRGGGGDYLSNESAYRGTLLRDALGLSIPVGHVHVPVMTRFLPESESLLTDAKFEAYRTAIVAQARLILEAIASSL